MFWSPAPPPSEVAWPPQEYDEPSIDLDPYLRMYTKYLYRSGVAVTVTLVASLLSFGWFDLKPNAAKVAGIIAVVAALPAIAVAFVFLRNEERAMTRNERLGLSNSRPWRAGVIGIAISIVASIRLRTSGPFLGSVQLDSRELFRGLFFNTGNDLFGPGPMATSQCNP